MDGATATDEALDIAIPLVWVGCRRAKPRKKRVTFRRRSTSDDIDASIRHDSLDRTAAPRGG
jgi:hypothetical protein